MKRALLVVVALAWAVQVQAAEGNCAGYCARHVGCLASLLKAESGKPMPRGEHDAALYRCTSECRERGLPPSVLGCLANSSCTDLGGPDGGPAFEKCEPVGLPAISRALQLGSRTGDACTDVCRHRTQCALGALATPTFDAAMSQLQRCRDGCKSDFSDDPALRDRYFNCIADVPCSRLTPEGLPSAEIGRECLARARAAIPVGSAVARKPSAEPSPASAAAAERPALASAAAGDLGARVGGGRPGTEASSTASTTTAAIAAASTPFADNFEVVLLEAPISGPACESAPLLEPDGKALVFNRFDPETLRDLGYFRSTRTATGWSTPVPYPVPAGANGVAFGADAQSLYFFAEVEPDAFGGKSTDVLMARRVGAKWGTPENLGPIVNSPGAETEVSLSTDGTTLVFSSDRPGTVGIMDLYVATRETNGQWGKPRNLGPAVSRPGDSQGSPRIAPGGRVLFFTAMLTPRGPLGVYATAFDGIRWLPRQVLSPLVDGPLGDEVGLAVAPSGEEAYFAADKGSGTRCSDLFVVRRVPSPALRTWRFDVRNATGHWTGDIVLERVGGGWTGKMRSDQIGTWQELRRVQLSGLEIRFDAPAAAQTYQGRLLPGGKVLGTFIWSGRSWDWTASETTTSR